MKTEQKGMQQIQDEADEAHWRRVHGPTLKAALDKATFALMLHNGEVPQPYASAPELLEALKALANDPIVSGMSARIRDCAQEEGRRNPWASARAAIVKAEGK